MATYNVSTGELTLESTEATWNNATGELELKSGVGDWNNATGELELTEPVVETCDPPTNFRALASAAVAGRIRLSWTAAPGADSYQVRSRKTAPGVAEVWQTAESGWATRASGHNFSGDAGASYQFQVRSVCGTVTSAAVSATATSPPAAPVLTATPSTSVRGRIDVSWPAVSGAASYQWQSKLSTASWPSSWTGATSITTTSFSATNLDRGSLYNFRVRATNAGGSSPTGTRTSRAPGKVPAKPATPVVTSADTTSGTTNTHAFSWPAIAGASRYRRQSRTRSIGVTAYGAWSAWRPAAGSTLTARTWRQTSAIGTQLGFRVRAEVLDPFDNTYVNGDYGEWTETAVLRPPNPQGLRRGTCGLLPSTSNPSIRNPFCNVTWNASARATAYSYRYRVGTGAWTPWSEASASRAGVMFVTPGSSHTLQVRASNASGLSPTSSFTFTAPSRTPAKPNTPVLTATTVTAGTRYTVTWPAVPRATDYAYQQRSRTIGGSWPAWSLPSTITTSRSVTVNSTATTQSEIRVRARIQTAYGEFVDSNNAQWTETVKLATPVVTRTSLGQQGNRNRWRFTWPNVAGATSYRATTRTFFLGEPGWRAWTAGQTVTSPYELTGPPSNNLRQIRFWALSSDSAVEDSDLTESFNL